MKRTWQKGSALLIVGVLMISTLVALISVPVVSADTELKSDGIDLVYDPTYMSDESIFYAEAGGNAFNLGEGDGLDDNDGNADTLTLTVPIIVTDPSDTIDDFWLNITDYDQDVFDFTDTDTGTTGVQVADGSNIAGTYNQGNLVTFTFQFDIIATNIPLGTSSQTEIEIAWDYISDLGGTPANVNGDAPAWIYISSIFDDDSMVPDEQLNNMNDTADDALFEAGDSFEQSQMNLTNYDDHDVTDLSCVMTEPGNGVTLSGGKDTCVIPNGVAAAATVQVNYRTDVAAQTPPGEYPGSAVITYTRDTAESGLTVTESGLAVDWDVGFSFANDNPVDDGDLYSEFQCRATFVAVIDDDMSTRVLEDVDVPSDTIEQSTFTDKKIQVNVTIENNGNTDLFNVVFQLDPAAWPNFRNPNFFYASDGSINRDSITLTVPQFVVGTTINFTIEFIVVNDIPIGEHRLPIVYNGFFWNNSELGDASGFFATNGGADLEIIFSLVVTDSVIACHAVFSAVTAGTKGDITANTITFSIVNDEGYHFIDVTVQANFNNTPWYVPVINQGGPLVWADGANPATPMTRWDAGASENVVFTVDTDSTLVPDRYPFELTITAVIEETLEVVTITIGQAEGCLIDFTGYGPEILITAFTADDIIPGETFELVLTIENVGDDTARDVWVSIPFDTTAWHPWDEEQVFKNQFDWTDVFGNWGNVTGPIEIPDGMFYTMESLDVDNIREIIEINLFMDGVYSMPGSTIEIIKLIDLAAGATTTATFTMIADKDMVNGKPYHIAVSISGIDSEGEGAPVNRTQNIEVMSSLPGDSYNPVELDWFTIGLKALGLLLFLIIVLALLLMVFNRYKGKPGEEEDEDEFGFEDDDEDEMVFEPKEEEAPPEPETPAAPEELVEP